MVIWFLWWAK